MQVDSFDLRSIETRFLVEAARYNVKARPPLVKQVAMVILQLGVPPGIQIRLDKKEQSGDKTIRLFFNLGAPTWRLWSPRLDWRSGTADASL
jgi:hypothetical protein